MKKIDEKKAGIIALVLIAAVAIIFLVFRSGGKSEFQKQLELGQKYLEDMDYEQAVAAFNKAIELNPRSADAYIGLADAYVGLGDPEAALAALQEGYEITGDERIQEYIDSLTEAMEGTSGNSRNTNDGIGGTEAQETGTAEDAFQSVTIDPEKIAALCTLDGKRVVDWTIGEAKELQISLEDDKGMLIGYTKEDEDIAVDIEDDMVEIWWTVYDIGTDEEYRTVLIRRAGNYYYRELSEMDRLTLQNRTTSILGDSIIDFLEMLAPGLSAYVGAEEATTVYLGNCNVRFENRLVNFGFYYEEEGNDYLLNRISDITVLYGNGSSKDEAARDIAEDEITYIDVTYYHD